MHPLRTTRVGDLVPAALLGPRPARRLEAHAIVLPGAAPLDGYLQHLDGRRGDFAAWDGRVVVHAADGGGDHRLLIVDRYGQTYAVHDADEATALPDGDALEEWFRFLATACPECGVLDDPVPAGPTP